MADRIDRELYGDPPVQIIRGKVIAPEVWKSLMRLRTILHSGKDYLNNLQSRGDTENRNNFPEKSASTMFSATILR